MHAFVLGLLQREERSDSVKSIPSHPHITTQQYHTRLLILLTQIMYNLNSAFRCVICAAEIQPNQVGRMIHI